VFVYNGVEPFFLFLACLVVSMVAIFWRKKHAVCIPACFLAVFFLGMMRMAVSGIVIEDGEQDMTRGAIQVDMFGIVSAEPTITQSRQILPVRISHISGMETGHALKDIRVFTTLIPSYQYGDELHVRCSLLPAQNKNGVRSRIVAPPICVQADIRRISRGKGSGVLSFLLQGKELFLNAIRTHLSEPHASLLGALLVGERNGFPKWLTDAFVRSGILHIVAISGYNITIMIVSMYTILRGFSVGRKKSFWYLVFGVFCFVLITGSSASVVRAALMGVVALFASTIGRKNNAGNAILLAGGVMIFWQPATLFDIGFQLSFVATCGLVYISPIFEQICEKFFDAYGIKTLALQTLSATIVTAPLLIFSFQRFSVIALVVNILVLPVIPLAMTLGFFWTGFAFIAGIVGMVIHLPFDLLIQITSWPVWFLLSYIVFVAQWFSHIPWASVDVRLGEWNWVFVYISYVCIVWLVWIYSVSLKKRQGVIQCKNTQKSRHD